MALEQAQRDFESLRPIAEEKLREIAGWLLVEHVHNDLLMDGVHLSRERVIEIVLQRAEVETQEDHLARNFAQAIERLTSVVASAVEADERPELTIELLVNLHRLAIGDTGSGRRVFRETTINPLYANHDPCSADELPSMLGVALDWFSADSIHEMTPIEQATLVHVRLYDLQPFAKNENRVIRLATSLYTLRAGLPPIILAPEQFNDYYRAVLAGLQMETQPLVELFARNLGATLIGMRRVAENG
jgi:Fic family protein